MKQIEIRSIKAGDTVFIKGSKIKAEVIACEYINNIWVYQLKGWPGKIIEELIEQSTNK